MLSEKFQDQNNSIFNNQVKLTSQTKIMESTSSTRENLLSTQQRREGEEDSPLRRVRTARNI